MLHLIALSAPVGSLSRSPTASGASPRLSCDNTTLNFYHHRSWAALFVRLGTDAHNCAWRNKPRDRDMTMNVIGLSCGVTTYLDPARHPRWLPRSQSSTLSRGWRSSGSQEIACLGVRSATAHSDTREYHGSYAAAGSNRLSYDKRRHGFIQPGEPYSPSRAFGHEHHGTLTVMSTRVCPGNPQANHCR